MAEPKFQKRRRNIIAKVFKVFGIVYTISSLAFGFIFATNEHDVSRETYYIHTDANSTFNFDIFSNVIIKGIIILISL